MNDELRAGVDLTEITITIEAKYVGTRITGPCLSSRVVSLKTGLIDSKFLEIPKPVHGNVVEVYDEHKRKIEVLVSKKNKADKLAKENRLHLTFPDNE